MTKQQMLELGLPLGPAIFDPHSLHDPISAIMGGVGLVGNVIGGVLGKSTANRAGDIQQAAGNAAASSITGAVATANPQIRDAALRAGTGVTAAAGTAGDNAMAEADRVREAARIAGAGATDAAGTANGMLDPYASAGADASRTLQNGLQAGGDFNKTPTLADLQIDPGYAFRLQQGEQTLARSAAARGGATSGEALKDLANYSQGAASQEYQNAFQRFQTATQNRYSNLSGVANRGIAAADTQGSNITGAARYVGDTGIHGADSGVQASEFGGSLNTNAAEFTGQSGINAANQMAANSIGGAKAAADYTTSGAAAKAAGMVGGANALSAGISGGIGSATSAVNMSNLLKNPALLKAPRLGYA